MNNHDSNTLLSSLDHAVDILGTHRTADPAMIATFDTLKQARAMVRQLVERGLLADAPGTSASPAELRAA